MFSCDYNGWADVPEDEREAMDAFEAGTRLSPGGPIALVIRGPALPAPRIPDRKAA